MTSIISDQIEGLQSQSHYLIARPLHATSISLCFVVDDDDDYDCDDDNNNNNNNTWYVKSTNYEALRYVIFSMLLSLHTVSVNSRQECNTEAEGGTGTKPVMFYACWYTVFTKCFHLRACWQVQHGRECVLLLSKSFACSCL